MSIGAAIGLLTGDLINPSAAGPRPLTVDDLVPILDDINYRFSIVADVFAAADTAAHESVTAATDAATQIEVVGRNVKDITEHTYTIVIPHSLSWLAGYIVSHFVTPLEERVGKLESAVAFLQGWRNQIDAWRHGFVDPNVELWVGFRQWFDGWPRGILFRWQDYFDNPGHFAAWAAPPLIGPIVAYFAAPDHKQSRDNLSRIMVDAWAEVPNDVWESILRWSVTTK